MPCYRLGPVKVNGKQSCADVGLMSLGGCRNESEFLDESATIFLARWILMAPFLEIFHDVSVVVLCLKGHWTVNVSC